MSQKEQRISRVLILKKMGRGVDQEAEQAGSVLRKARGVGDILPPEEADYYEALKKKHFSKNGSGSLFDKSITLEDLIKKNAEKLLASQDDRQEFIRLGVDPQALLPDRSYFLLEAPGKSGLLAAEGLEKEREIIISREKPGSLSFLVYGDNLSGEKTEWATAIVGDYPRDPSRRALITVFPGLPTDPERSAVGEENEFSLIDGQRLTLGELKNILGRDDLLLQVRGQG